MVEDVDHLISQGRLDEALDRITSFNIHQQVQGKIFSSHIFELQGNYQLAYNLAAEALAMSLEEGRTLEELGARIALSYALVRLKRYEDAQTAIEQGFSLLELIPAAPYWQFRRYEATLHNVNGLLQRHLGHLDLAEQYYRKSLDIRSKLDVAHEIGISLTNLGTLYRIRGELDKAIEYHNEAKDLFTMLGNEGFLAYTLHDLGTVYWERDDPEQAIACYQESLTIRLDNANAESSATTLLDLIMFHLEYDSQKQAEFYFDILKDLHSDHDTIRIYYQLARALILSTSSRLIKRAQAQQIFHELEQQSLSVDHQAIVYLNLCHLYLADLRLSHDEELIEDVENLIDKLLKLAKSQYSPILLVETLLIQSKFYLVQLDLETAQQLLFQAEMKATEKNLTNLAIKVSHEHDQLIDKLHKWDYLKRRKTSIVERLKAVDLDHTLDNVLTRRLHDKSEPQLEDPLFLLVMSQDAIPVYTIKFDEDVMLNQDLIGSFLLASDMGIEMALPEPGSIERIKYGDYTLIFMRQDQLAFCYGYRGQSYFAIRRLQDFINRIKLGRTWQLLTTDVPKPKQVKHDMDPKVHDYFSKDGIYSNQLLE